MSVPCLGSLGESGLGDGNKYSTIYHTRYIVIYIYIKLYIILYPEPRAIVSQIAKAVKAD